jgi:hypothetical protein
LDFSRRAVLDRRPLDLVPFVKEQVKLWEHTLPENIHITLTCAEDAYIVNADLTRMQQMLINLVVNARDAMPDGGDLRVTLAQVRVKNASSAPHRNGRRRMGAGLHHRYGAAYSGRCPARLFTRSSPPKRRAKARAWDWRKCTASSPRTKAGLM